MVLVVSTGAGALWLAASLFLLALVTFVILTGDSIDHLDPSSSEGRSSGTETADEEHVEALH